MAVSTERRVARPIPTSRLLVGILLHFCAPAYLLTCLATCLLGDPPVDDVGSVVGRMAWTALWFLPGFLLLTGAAAGVGAVLDRHRDRSPDAAETARAHVAAARQLLAPLHHSRLTQAMAAMDAVRWDYAEARYQRVAADLDAAARTFFAAASSAGPDRRPAILNLAADSIEGLGVALAELHDEKRRLDEGDARTVATYLDARYGDGAR